MPRTVSSAASIRQLPRYAIERATALIAADRRRRAGPVIEADAARTPAAAAAGAPAPRAAGARARHRRRPTREVERILRALGMQVVADGRGLAGHAADAPLRHRHRRRPDRRNRPHPRLRRDPGAHAGRRDRAWPRRARRAWPKPTLRRAAGRARLPGGDQLRLRRWRSCWRPGSCDGGAVALANPLSAELGVMRTSLLPGLVDALRAQPRAPADARAPVRDRAACSIAPATERRAASRPAASPPSPAAGARRAVGRRRRAKSISTTSRATSRACSALAGGDGGIRSRDSSPSATRAAAPKSGATAGGSAGSATCIRACCRRWTCDGEVVAFELDLEPLVARARAARGGAVAVSVRPPRPRARRRRNRCRGRD